MVGAAATRLKQRLDLIYRNRSDDDWRKFSGAHETVLPLCSAARSIFNQLRKSTTVKASKERVSSGAASKINCPPDGSITGMEMCHILLLPPFLLFDLLVDVVEEHNAQHGTGHVSPASDLIGWVLVLLEWYRLYRCHRFHGSHWGLSMLNCTIMHNMS